MEDENEPVVDTTEKETKADLVKALAAAKADFPRIEKSATANIPTKTGKSYSYSYATLDVVRNCCDPVLAKHGLAVIHTTTIRDSGQLLLTTTLWHESGQSIQSFWPLIADPGDPQKVGSAMTYAERYTYCAIVGVAAGDDDDGAKAMEKSKRKPTAKKQSRPPTQTDTEPAKENERGKRNRGIVVDLAKAMGVNADTLEAYGKDKAEFRTTAKATLTFNQALSDEEKRKELIAAFNVWGLGVEPEVDNGTPIKPAAEELDTDTLITRVAAKLGVDDAAFGGWVATYYQDIDVADKELGRALEHDSIAEVMLKKFQASLGPKAPGPENGDSNNKKDLFEGGNTE